MEMDTLIFISHNDLQPMLQCTSITTYCLVFQITSACHHRLIIIIVIDNTIPIAYMVYNSK